MPSKPSLAPDSFCTWNIQGYVASYTSSPALRQEMTEKNVFSSGVLERWGEMFSRLHKEAVFSIGRCLGPRMVPLRSLLLAVPLVVDTSRPRADVVLRVLQCDKPFGIFGYYNSLAIQADRQTPCTKIFAQDLAGNISTDITRQGNGFTIPGKVIDTVGLAAATKGDKSEPGMVLLFQK